MKSSILRLRAAPAAMLSACLALSGAASSCLAAGIESAVKTGADAAAPGAIAVASIPQFNNWLISLNSGLGLPPQDLAAISYQADKLLSASPSGTTARFDAAAGRIVMTPPSGAAATAPAAIDLKALPQLRANVSKESAWLENVASSNDPQALADALNRFFDRTAARAGSVQDPVQRTAEVLAGKLPEEMRSPFDPAAGERQRTALKAWHDAPHRTYVLVNSYSFKDDGTPGLNYYDMRSLAQILWAADPKVDVVFVTALPVDEAMVRHVLQGHPHAEQIRKRVHFVSLNDDGTDFLSQKLLDPKHSKALDSIRGLINRVGAPAVLYPYMGGPYEWRIARELGIPDSVYAAHPSMIYWGTKSGGRKIFKAALSRYSGTAKIRMRLADGAEDLYDTAAAADALGELLRRRPGLSRVAVKLNLGSSGEGNTYPAVAGWEKMSAEVRRRSLEDVLRAAPLGVPDENGRLDTFADALGSEGAALEEFIPGIGGATFPSVQSEILPDGSVRLLSSHEQILMDGNNYIGATLAADKAYRAVIERTALETAKELAKKGVVGRFGTDFAAIRQADGSYDIYCIENNIRLTGTTHPLVAASGLTGAVYDRGLMRIPQSKAVIGYKSMDHDVRPNLVGLEVDRFLARFDRDDARGLLFDPKTRKGVLFHLVPAVKAAGNVGYTIIARGARSVRAIQKRLSAILNDLELEHLAGGAVPLHRFTAEDLRGRVEEQIGHARQVKLFKTFLEDHPEDVYRRGDDAGIVFHPHGYTVLGRDAGEISDLEAEAERLLKAFAAEAVPNRS